MDTNRIFAGVDLSAGKRRLTVALLTGRLEVRSLKDRTPAEAVEELASFEEITVAIGGPLRPRQAAAACADPLGEALRGGGARRARAAEAELTRRGIPVRRTPILESAAPAWMRAGFRLAAELARRGFAAGKEVLESPNALLETHPAACAAILLGRLPFGRDTLEGRIQRQLALLREKVALPDPMDALEEITPHHLLSGRLSLEGVCRAEELDALLVAYAAWRSWSAPESVVRLGDDTDGWICLPAKELLEKYSK
jgi:predicted nuclease with RNAse H fold